ncbi:MAG: hypothetical protein ACI4KR_12450 [Ruminiclostridium sp.]
MEKYVAPEMEIVEFEAEDVITTSNTLCPNLDETEIKFGTGYPN